MVGNWQRQCQTAAGASMTLQITFDDGYDSIAPICERLIDQYDHNPVVYIPTAYLGRRNSWDFSGRVAGLKHLSEREVERLASRGVRFGSHGDSHTALTELSTDWLASELNRSRSILQSITGQEIASVSYPFGRVNTDVVKAAIAAGYRQGVTMQLPRDSDSPMVIGRVPIYGYDTNLSIERKLRPGAWHRIERAKAAIVNSLNVGTVIMQRIRTQGAK